MATEIDAGIQLLSGKVLILADVVEDEAICTGVVERIGPGVAFLVLDIPAPDPPVTTPPTPRGPPIGTEHAHVVFSLEKAQEVKIGEIDYFLMHEDNVLGILPVPYEERLF